MPRQNDAALNSDSDGLVEIGGTAPETMPRKLFVSYTREDKAIANKVAEALASHGYDVFWDVKIPTGEKFDTYLFRKLNESNAVVVLWSINSVQSDYVKEEAEFGKNHKALVPLRIDQTPLPFGFTRIQTTDIADWYRSARAPEWQLVVDSIESALGGETVYNSYGPESGFVTKPVTKKHGLHLGPRALIAIAVVAIALLGFFVLERQSGDTTNANAEAIAHQTQDPSGAVATSGKQQSQGTEHPVVQQDASAARQEAVAGPTSPESKPSRTPIVARRPADLTVIVFPWGDVWINGKAKGSAPLKNQPLKPGRYKVSAGQGTATKTRTVRLAPEEEKTLYFDLTK
jgi:hypothetical protein